MKAIHISVIDILRHVGFATSNSEARRLLAQGAVRIDNEPQVSDDMYFAGSEFILRCGKRKYARVIFPAMKEWYTEKAEDYWK